MKLPYRLTGPEQLSVHFVSLDYSLLNLPCVSFTLHYFYCTPLLLFALFCATVCINYNQSFIIFQFYFPISLCFLFFPQFTMLVFVHFSSFIFYYIEISHNLLSLFLLLLPNIFIFLFPLLLHNLCNFLCNTFDISIFFL